ncbi:hypothetical protein KKB18_11660 [bacterium]|nr:hypothetical protein [bacterium]
MNFSLDYAILDREQKGGFCRQKEQFNQGEVHIRISDINEIIKMMLCSNLSGLHFGYQDADV